MPVTSDMAGIQYINITKWDKFIPFVQEVKEASQYIWRGQSNSEWDLVSSFDRLFKNGEAKEYIEKESKRHLDRFKYVVRGKLKYDNICGKDENEMWALAQHYGLKTPLLDWTYSPFVALFFAIHNHINKEKTVSIWGLGNINNLNRIAKEHEHGTIIRFHPKQKMNSRLISQNGLFTRVPFGQSLNELVVLISEHNYDYAHLFKIDIKFDSNDIKNCLIFLNRMNINYYTLFPDAEGVTKFCNMAFSIPNYHRFW